MKPQRTVALFGLIPALLALTISESHGQALHLDRLGDDDPLCVSQNIEEKEILLAEQPEWFAKADPDDEFAFVIYSDGNRIVNLRTGEVHRLPGQYDPVPSPDGLVLSVPGDHISFHDLKSMKDKINSGAQNPSIAEIPAPGSTLSAVYQSVGLLSVNGNERSYRVIDDENPNSGGVAVQDFTRSGTGPMTAKGPERRLCSRIADASGSVQSAPTLRLPMISKDGTMLAAYNGDTGKTFILDVDPSDPSLCRVKSELPIGTGKAEFSFDGKKVVFHVDTSSDNAGNWFNSPDDNTAMNIYTYEFETGKITPISNFSNRNIQSTDQGMALRTQQGYYPSFRRDGKIVYVKVSDGGPDGRISSFVIANPNDLPNRAVDCQSPENFEKLMAIGKVWTTICHRLGNTTTLRESGLLALSLDPVLCRQMVERYWNEEVRTKISSAVRNTVDTDSGNRLAVLSAADLAAACPSNGATSTTATTPGTDLTLTSVPGDTTPVRKSDGKLVASCISCHGGAIVSQTQNRIIPAFGADLASMSDEAVQHWLDTKPVSSAISPGDARYDADKVDVGRRDLAQKNKLTWRQKMSTAISGPMFQQFQQVVSSEEDQKRFHQILEGGTHE